MTATPAAPPIGLGTRVSYGVGAIANGVKNVTFSAYLMFFYNQVVGVPASIVAGAIALTLLVDAFVDPFLGRWSDTLRTRWGRRHPFIYASAAPTALFFAFVWFPPQGLTDSQIGLWVFVTAMLTRVSISAFEISTQAMTPELTDDYAERTRLFSWRYWFLYIGQYGFSTICLLTFFRATAEYPKGQLNPDSYVGFAVVGSVLMLVSMIVCGLGTHNRIPYLPQPAPNEPRSSVWGHLREMFGAFRNRAFLAIFGFGVLKFTAIGLYAATALYFNTYLFQLDAAQLALLTLDSVVAATIAAPLAPVMSNLMGKRTSSMVFGIAGILLGLAPLYLTYFDMFLRPGDPGLLPVLFVIGAIYGAMIAISLINTTSMLADVVEDGAVRSGQRQAGVFFAASSFMQQCSSALGVALNGRILTAADFPEKVKPEQVTDAMMDSLLAHYIPIQLALWIVGCLILVFYPITRARHEANVAALRAREAEALAKELDNAPLGAPVR